MHSLTCSDQKIEENEGEILLSISTLVTEGRIPETKGKGPHGLPRKEQQYDAPKSLGTNYEFVREQVLKLWTQNIPICIEVILTCGCQKQDEFSFIGPETVDNCILLETWNFCITNKRVSAHSSSYFQISQLENAIRSQLYFSQITAWLLITQDSKTSLITNKNLRYRFAFPGETFKTAKFMTSSIEHTFPSTEIGANRVLNVSFSSLPRMSKFPTLHCSKCQPLNNNKHEIRDEKMDDEDNEEDEDEDDDLLDDRMHMFCTLNGKHHCEDYEEIEHKNELEKLKFKRSRQHYNYKDGNSASTSLKNESIVEDKSKILLEAIEKVGLGSPEKNARTSLTSTSAICANKKCECDNNFCDTNRINKFSLVEKNYCDNSNSDRKNASSVATIIKRGTNFENKRNNNLNNSNNNSIPSAVEQAKFRKSLDNAASMVFHSRTGLPLTSSPAPVRKGKTCFDYDSTINSVSAIKNALFSSSFSTDDDSESDGSLVSPCSPETYLAQRVKIESEPKSPVRLKNHRKGHDSSLLGSFEESVLNGRLEPVSTVQGFTAELGASGSFVPKHSVIPVTVFFYTLGDNDKISSPYLCHINLGKKGYYVPKRGTVQVTLFNPLGTVVKMFVIMYDLNDMPPNSQTFIRQRTLYMPSDCQDQNIEWGPKWLKYLIHLRFSSSKSGKIYLHKDIRMIILHKSDLDTATAHSLDLCYELRSFTIMPTNPRFSPRK